MNNQLSVKKPVILKPIQISCYRDFFKALSKAAINGVTQQWSAAVQNAVEAIVALGLKNYEEELAWQLLNRSMGQALCALASENSNTFALLSNSDIVLCSQKLLTDSDIVINLDFFEAPSRSNYVSGMQSLLASLLEEANITPLKASLISERLPSFFIFALHNEWRKNRNKYSEIYNYFDTPFTKATRHETDWLRYNSWLERQINESIFDEPFCLEQIYVPLCAFYKETKKIKRKEDNKEKIQTRTEKIVVSLDEWLEKWLLSEDTKDAFRVISGGPGSGKSSFAKIFAVKAARALHRTLFIPLHLIDLKKDLGEAIGSYLSEGDFFSENPYSKEEKLFIIFDGLDELTQQGKACVEIAKNFLEEVQKHTDSLNHTRLRLKVLFTGRELVVQSLETNFRKQGQILYILPYLVPDEERHEFTDSSNQLSIDRRDLWWNKYGVLSGHGYEKLPFELNKQNIDELTTHPLLNYLVALSYDRKTVSFSNEANTNIIYRDLINAVYDRNYAHGRHRALCDITEDQFIDILEEISVSAWHGSGRATTIKEIETYCMQNDIKVLLEKFQEQAKAGVTNLLAAFYFRHADTRQDGSETFEFTHKTFSEYLLSRRIVRQLQMMNEMTKESGYRGWSEGECLRRWALLCSGGEIDYDIMQFLENEISLEEMNTVKEWQKLLSRLISYMLRCGMPYEALKERPSFQDELRFSRNAETALLACLCACAQTTQEISNIDWPLDSSAGDWLAKLRGQRVVIPSFPCSCLCYLNLSYCNLICADFYYAELYGSNLSYANLSGANLSRANLTNVNLTGANVQGAIMFDAELVDISTDTELDGALLSPYSEYWSNEYIDPDVLRHADLQGANLAGVNLSGADLSGAKLCDANLSGADLARSDLSYANLQRSFLYRADMRNTDLNVIKKDT